MYENHYAAIEEKKADEERKRKVEALKEKDSARNRAETAGSTTNPINSMSVEENLLKR